MVLYSFHTTFDFFYFQENIPTEIFLPFYENEVSYPKKIPALVSSLIGLCGLPSLSRVRGL